MAPSRTRRAGGTRSGRAGMRSRGLLTELLGRPTRESSWLRVAGWMIRARAELTVLLMLLAVWVLLRTETTLTPHEALIAETAGIVVIAVLPGTRARMWAVTSRHRIWTCMVQTRVMTPDGRMPYLLWASPSPVGERIQVWLPAGLSVNDLEQTTEALAAACYATEARIEVNARWTHLVTIQVSRRDPFTGKRLNPAYRNPLRDRITRPTRGKRQQRDEFVPLPERDLVVAQTAPAEWPGVTALHTKGNQRANTSPSASTPGKSEGEQAGRTTSRTAAARTNAGSKAGSGTTSEPASDSGGRGVGGMDISDYV